MKPEDFPLEKLKKMAKEGIVQRSLLGNFDANEHLERYQGLTMKIDHLNMRRPKMDLVDPNDEAGLTFARKRNEEIDEDLERVELDIEQLAASVIMAWALYEK